MKHCKNENANILQIDAPALLLAYHKLLKMALKLLQETFPAGSNFFQY